MIDPKCPYGSKNYEDCYVLHKNWNKWPPECLNCCEETEKELEEEYGNPNNKDN